MNYIEKNILSFGNSSDEIKSNLEELLRYIYIQFPLNHEKMIKLYEHVKVPVNFDDNYTREDFNDHYRLNLKFLNYFEKDHKYIYKFKKQLQLNYFGNNDFIEEVHEYLLKNPSKNLNMKITTLCLKNVNGVNKSSRGIKQMDWKLYFWKTFDVDRITGIRFHDLIIAAHKIRSHKFENNYELYTGIKKMELSTEALNMQIRFDHGS